MAQTCGISAVVAAVVSCTMLVGVFVEIHLRSHMSWPAIVKDWERFGWGRSAACIVSNAVLRVWGGV